MTDGYVSHEDAIQKVLQEKYAGVQTEAFVADKARIEGGEPWQYVLGHSIFLDCFVDLSRRPMIPRPETAFWVEKVIEEWKRKGPVLALDLYAGAGNIGLALLKHLPEARVLFSELDAALLPGIAQSIQQSGIDADRTELVQGDSLENVHGRFDIIAANPPYIDPAHEQELDPEMAHEPHIAFFGSSDGMGHARELILRGRDFLTEHGVIYCECDNEQVPSLKEILAGTDWNYEFRQDPYGGEGVMVLKNTGVQ